MPEPPRSGRQRRGAALPSGLDACEVCQSSAVSARVRRKRTRESSVSHFTLLRSEIRDAGGLFVSQTKGAAKWTTRPGNRLPTR
jgi:hypothetical protein